MSDPAGRKRRVPLRWITLGEAVAVSAVLISGAGLWLSYREHEDAAVERAADKAPAPLAPLTLRAAAASNGEQLSLAPLREAQVIQSQIITFPKALGVDPVETTGDPRIEAAWFDRALRNAREQAGKPDETKGDERLAVLVETQLIEGDKPSTDRAIYDIGYAVREGGFFGGSHVALRGVSLVARGAGVERAEALWARRMSSPAK
ncbi:hypothetical protein [Sphingomonas sp. ID0503]|uniref:hypothetical protein n=1 Tax=Sphingomonas sp. ID0503 TaxID=3399691 RepID=UPI003AFA9EAA